MSFGSDPFGGAPFGGGGASGGGGPVQDFDLLLDDAKRLGRVLLLEITPYVSAFTTKAVGFSAGSVSALYDSRIFSPRITEALSVEQTMAQSSLGLSGGSGVTFGEVSLAWPDGGIDSLVDLYWDGAPIQLLLGAKGAQYGSFQAVFTGVVEDATWTTDRISFVVRDPAGKLDRQLQLATYDGDGGAQSYEGDAAIADQLRATPKPVAFGAPRHVTPVLVNSAYSVYQFHDGVAKGVDAVYANGGEILPFGSASTNDITQLGLASLFAWNPVDGPSGLGTFITDLSRGLFRIGRSTPPSGLVVTADVKGDNADPRAVYPITAAAIALRMLRGPSGAEGWGGGLPDAEIDFASFDALATANAAPVSYYSTGTENVLSAVDRVLDSVMGWRAFDRLGALHVGRVEIGTPSRTIRPWQVGDRIQRLRTPVPRLKSTLRYAPSWTVFRPDDVPEAASDAYRAFVTAETRSVFTFYLPAGFVHRLAEQVTEDSLFDVEADAQTEVERRSTLFSTRRHFYRIEAEDLAFRVKPGDTVTLKHPRWGLSAGKDFLVTSVSETTSLETTTLLLWG